MSETVLVTGASGFIGREVVRSLVAQDTPVIAFARRQLAKSPGVTAVQGDLLVPTDLDRAFKGAQCVLHLAAAVGKAPAKEMHRVNVEGTQAVLNACDRHGVRRLVHVSTIATQYQDLSDYPYGQTKLESERRVMASTLDWTVVRPTIVLGPGSPALGPLRSLASGPALMLPGGGQVQVQPIDVRDVGTSLASLASDPEAVRAVVDLGGPDRLTMAALLERIRIHDGKRPGPVLPIPLLALRTVAKVTTAVLGTRSPVTPGQLTAFRFDSTADQPPPGCATAADHGIDAMLSDA